MGLPLPELQNKILAVENCQEKLILLVGMPGSGKSKVLRELACDNRFRVVDCQFLLTNEFIETLPQDRQEEAPRIIGEQLDALDVEVIVLEGVEKFFRPVFCLEPLPLLRELSKKRCIIAAWPGRLETDSIIYAGRNLGDAEKVFSAEGIQCVTL